MVCEDFGGNNYEVPSFMAIHEKLYPVSRRTIHYESCLQRTLADPFNQLRIWFALDQFKAGHQLAWE